MFIVKQEIYLYFKLKLERAVYYQISKYVIWIITVINLL